ncbi:MAG: ABC-type ATPase involved in cell division, partial [Flavobacteriales bacterium]
VYTLNWHSASLLNIGSRNLTNYINLNKGVVGLALTEKKNITFLFSSHDQHVIDRAKRLIKLRDGRIESDERRD